MKKSEQIRQRMNAEESDFRFMSLNRSLVREERMERFTEHWLPKLKEVTWVEYHPDAFKYVFRSRTGKTYHFFPKSNSILVKEDNKYIKRGLRHIISEFNLGE